MTEIMSKAKYWCCIRQEYYSKLWCWKIIRSPRVLKIEGLREYKNKENAERAMYKFADELGIDITE